MTEISRQVSGSITFDIESLTRAIVAGVKQALPPSTSTAGHTALTAEQLANVLRETFKEVAYITAADSTWQALADSIIERGYRVTLPSTPASPTAAAPGASLAERPDWFSRTDD